MVAIDTAQCSSGTPSNTGAVSVTCDANDLVLVFITKNRSQEPGVWSTPSGWTKIFEDNVGNPNDVALFGRYFTSSQAATSHDFTTANIKVSAPTYAIYSLVTISGAKNLVPSIYSHLSHVLTEGLNIKDTDPVSPPVSEGILLAFSLAYIATAGGTVSISMGVVEETVAGADYTNIPNSSTAITPTSGYERVIEANYINNALKSAQEAFTTITADSDSIGAYSENVLIWIQPDNATPEVPTGLVRTSDVTDRTPTFEASIDDYDLNMSEQVKARFQLQTSGGSPIATFDSAFVSVPSVVSAEYTTNLTIGNSYKMRVKAIDDQSVESAYSASISFTIYNTITKDLETIWDVKSGVILDLVAIWDAKAVITKDLQAIWDVVDNEIINKDVQFIWDIAGVTTKDLELVWDDKLGIELDLELIWDVLISWIELEENDIDWLSLAPPIYAGD